MDAQTNVIWPGYLFSVLDRPKYLKYLQYLLCWYTFLYPKNQVVVDYFFSISLHGPVYLYDINMCKDGYYS